ncbi:restriction endonuclease subunit S [Novilysobacter luteus]|uniref:Type-1 restriction enzyme EcoKI specificity protein n=1 Tax=Novilysobacter luteus TaxID=2822368 RepID=A0ABM8UH47_9GAMM|nr:restriction endonuclease subunit S [Lysobacter luteus]CAG4975405.1 Type-1 restriction enzyme EcoKI specificity protein [Lysobacter luteus]
MRNGWLRQSLGAICEVVNGGTPKTGVVAYWDGQHQWITPAEMGRRTTPYIGETARTLTDLGLSNSSARPLPPYSVILSSRAPIGHLVINTVPMATNQGCKGLVPSKVVDHKFLYYYLGSVVELLNDLGTGATFKELSGGKLKEVPIPLPPLPEQQRIVGILDEAFAGIATAKANAEKNLKNARALFESHLQSVFNPRSGDWVEDKLESLTTKIGSGATPRGGEKCYKAAGVSLIRSLNVHDLGFRYPKLAFLDEDQAADLSNVKVQADDVLLNITGASVARCCVVPPDVLPARVNQHVSIVRPIVEKLDAAFLHYLLISKPYKDALLKTGEEGGSTRQAITKAQIQSFTIGYPVLSEQRAIVERLNAVLAETQRLESICQRKLAALDTLKQSLLHQAFSGQL